MVFPKAPPPALQCAPRNVALAKTPRIWNNTYIAQVEFIEMRFRKVLMGAAVATAMSLSAVAQADSSVASSSLVASADARGDNFFQFLGLTFGTFAGAAAAAVALGVSIAVIVETSTSP